MSQYSVGKLHGFHYLTMPKKGVKSGKFQGNIKYVYSDLKRTTFSC